MSESVIIVENVSKRYVIGHQRSKNDGLRHIIEEAVRTPFKWLRGRGEQKKKQNEDFWALKDVSFEVKQGEVLGIIGRNGAGKSTLLKILSRITEPTRGRIQIDGRVACLLEVGTGFHPDLTGRENIYLNGAILGMAQAEVRRKFDEIVDFSGVEKFIDTPVKRFSSGMYMRLAFAVAAHLEPEILVIDEVLAVGDAAFQKKCLGKMKSVSSSGRTVLFVSHNMNAIEMLCERIVYLVDGKVREQTTDVRRAISQYINTQGPNAMECEWLNFRGAFANPWFRPTRFFVGDQDGNIVQMSVRNDMPIYVYVEGEIKEHDIALNVGFALYDEAGTLLYWSCQTDAKEEEWPCLKMGRNVLRCGIPQRLLNEGNYRLELIVGLYMRHWISQPGSNAPSISLSINGGLSDSPYWMERRPGFLAPVCSWALMEDEGLQAGFEMGAGEHPIGSACSHG